MKPFFLRYSVLRPWLWRWHRRAGLATAAILLLVTVTGILLNHSSELSLSRNYVGQSWLLSFYGIPEPELKTFTLGDSTITGDDRGQLYWGTEMLTSCRGELMGAAQHDTGFVVACEQELLFLDEHGRLLEKISATYGLPTPLTHLGKCGEQLCVRTPERLFELDFISLSFKPLLGVRPIWSQATQLAEASRQSIYKLSRGKGLSWERVMLDVHSGRLFGTAGVWVVDVAAVLLLFLALSGFVLWYQHMRVKRVRN